MTDEANVAAARRFGDALEAGDLKDAAAELAPDVEIDDRDIPDADWQDSFYAWIARWNEAFDGWRTDEGEILAGRSGRGARGVRPELTISCRRARP